MRFVCKTLIFLFLLVKFSAFRTRHSLMMERLVSSTKSCILFFNHWIHHNVADHILYIIDTQSLLKWIDILLSEPTFHCQWNKIESNELNQLLCLRLDLHEVCLICSDSFYYSDKTSWWEGQRIIKTNFMTAFLRHLCRLLTALQELSQHFFDKHCRSYVFNSSHT